MDFLKDMQAKLNELEEFAKEAQAQHQQQQQKQQRDPTPLFTPKQKRAERKAFVKKEKQRKKTKDKTGQQQARRKQSQQSFAPQPMDHGGQLNRQQGQAGARPPQRRRLVESLIDNLDDAFLIQEILGPPLCLRDDDD